QARQTTWATREAGMLPVGGRPAPGVRPACSRCEAGLLAVRGRPRTAAGAAPARTLFSRRVGSLFASDPGWPAATPRPPAIAIPAGCCIIRKKALGGVSIHDPSQYVKRAAQPR